MLVTKKSKKIKPNFLTDLSHREIFQKIQQEANQERGRQLLQNPTLLIISAPKPKINTYA